MSEANPGKNNLTAENAKSAKKKLKSPSPACGGRLGWGRTRDGNLPSVTHSRMALRLFGLAFLLRGIAASREKQERI